ALGSTFDVLQPVALSLRQLLSHRSARCSIREQSLRDDPINPEERALSSAYGAPATEVHHRNYPRFVEETSVDDLVSLCRRCHEHRPRTGTPMTYKEWS